MSGLGRQGSCPCRAQTKGAHKLPGGAEQGRTSFLLIQFQDEQKIKIFAIFVQGAKIRIYGSVVACNKLMADACGY
jgi:hypothetical protein